MKWTVVWTPSAQSDLTTIWLEAANRSSVTAAAHRLELALHRHPQEAGESRDKDERVLIDLPLMVKYRVLVDDCLVEVLGVWQPLKRRGG